MPKKKEALEATDRWAKVENGQVVSVGPRPDVWTNPDDSVTTAAPESEVDPKDLIAAGYLPVVVAPPTEIPTTENPVNIEVTEHRVENKRVVEVQEAVEVIPPTTAVSDRETILEQVRAVEALYVDVRDRYDAALHAIEANADVLERIRIKIAEMDRMIAKGREMGLAD